MIQNRKNSSRFISAWALTLLHTLLLVLSFITEPFYFGFLGLIWGYWFGSNAHERKLNADSLPQRSE